MTIHPDPIRLTDEQMRLLDDWCARTGRPAAELLAEALDGYRPAESRSSNGTAGETLSDRLLRKGLLGCLTGGPADLSTNPDHMKGFGE